MPIKFKGDMQKVVAKNKGDMSKISTRQRIAQAIVNNPSSVSITKKYTKMLMHFNDTNIVDSTISAYAPMQGVLSPDGTKAYVGTWGASSATNGVHVIDVATNTKLSTIPTSLTAIHITTNSTGTRVYATGYGTTNSSNGGDKLYIIDPVAGSILHTVTTGGGCHSSAITPNDKFLFVACEVAGLYRIDLSAATPAATLLGNTTWGKYAPIVSADGTKLYVSIDSSVKVYSLDQITGAISLLSTLTGFSGAYTATKTNTTAYYLNNGAGTVTPISFSTSTKGSDIAVGSGPYGASASPDGKKVYIANNSGNSVSVIDTSTNKLISIFTGASSPRGTVATNSKVFILNNSYNTISVRDDIVYADEAQSPLRQDKYGTVVTTTSQSKFGGRSLLLNGTNTNKLQFANTKVKQIDLLDKPFCVEGWFYLTTGNFSGNAGLISWANTDSGDCQGVHIDLNASNRFEVFMSTNGSNWDLGSPTITTSVSPTLNTWFHLALIRETVGGDIKLVHNGTVIGTRVTTSSLYTGDYMYIAKTNYQNNTRINGYIDDVRVVVGSCPYSASAFVVPTAQLTATADTKFLLNGNDKIEDSSSLGLYTQTLGSATLSTVQSKFGGSSLKIASATGDNIRVLNNAQPIELLDRPFTIEGWFWLNANTGGPQPLIMMASTGDGQGPIIITESNNTLAAYLSNGSSWTYLITTTHTPTANAWHHVALVREYTAGPIKLYCDGILRGSNNTTASVFTSQKIWLGHYPYFTNPSGARTLNGYVDEVRITLDQCMYSAAFTPPTAPFTPWEDETQPARRVALDSNDVLAWNFDETTGTYLNRGTAGALNLYPSTGASISSRSGVFGNCAYNAAGATYGLRTSNTTLGEVANNLSVSCWVKVENWGNYNVIVQKWYSSTGAGGNPYTSIAMGLTGAGNGEWYCNVSTNGSQNLVTSPAGSRLALNTWSHIGFTFSNGTLKMYKDGVLAGTSTGIAGNIDWGTHGQWNVLGHPQESGTNNRLNGFVDDVRISNVTRDASYFQSLYASGLNNDTYSFAANTLPGLKVWYKADAITGVNDGGTVSSWIDSSGNGKNMTTISGAPVYKQMTMNGKPAVIFNGSSWLSNSSHGLPTGSAARTMYAVGYGSSTGVHSMVYWGNGNPGRFGFIFNNTSRFVEFGSGLVSNDAPSPNGLGGILSFPYVGGTAVSANTLYMNGLGGTGGSSSVLNTGTSGPLYLGRLGDGDSQYPFVGAIAEVLIFDRAHTTSERQQVEAYLATKYGITVAN